MNICIAELVYIKRKIRISKKKFKIIKEPIIIDHLPEIMKMLEGSDNNDK